MTWDYLILRTERRVVRFGLWAGAQVKWRVVNGVWGGEAWQSTSMSKLCCEGNREGAGGHVVFVKIETLTFD